MTKKEIKMHKDTGSSKENVSTRDHTRSVLSKQELHSDKQFPEDDTEHKSTIQVEIGTAHIAGNVRAEATEANQYRGSDETRIASESRKYQQEPKINLQTENGSLEDIKKSTSQTSKVLSDKLTNITELCSQNINQNENDDAFVNADGRANPLTKLKPVTQRTENIKVAESGTADSSLPLDSRQSRSDEYQRFEDRNIFQTEGALSQLPVTNEPKSHTSIETSSTQYAGSEVEKPCDRIVKSTGDKPQCVEKNESRVLFNTGGERLQSLFGSGNSRSNRQYSKQHRHGPMNVGFIKSTGINQHHNPKGEHRYENRDIFETGGEETKNPRLGHLLGTSRAEEEEIEYLADETPEPAIIITPAISYDQEPRINLGMQIRTVFAVASQCCRLFLYMLLRQIAKEPAFYIISVIIIFFCGRNLETSETDGDIPACVIIAFIFFIAITFMFDRGQCSPYVEELEKNSCFGLCKECKRINWIVCCACCRPPEPEVERHSRYRHLEEDTDVTFEHEVADISNIDPNDCPQMRMVKQEEFRHSESPDYPLEVSQVNVDVHVSGKRNSEKLGAVRKHYDKAAQSSSTKSEHKNKSKNTYPSHKLTKTFKADVHGPETTVNPKGMYEHGHRQQLASSESSELSPALEAAAEDRLSIIRELLHQRPTEDNNIGSSVTEPGNTSKNLEYISTREHKAKSIESKYSQLSNERDLYKSKGMLKKLPDYSPKLPEPAFVSDTSKLLSYTSDTESFENEQTKFSHKKDKSNVIFPDALTHTTDVSSSDVPTSVTSSPDEFICEHYGQGVACSCPMLLSK